MSKADPAKAHGLNGYTNRGCRCEVCRAAQSAYMRAWLRRQPGYDERHARYERNRLALEAAHQRGRERRAVAAARRICPRCLGRKSRDRVICRACYFAQFPPKHEGPGRPFILNPTASELARREYMREYMRAYRARQRSAA